MDGKLFVPAAGLVIAAADLDWVDPCAETKYYFAVVVDVLPIKGISASLARVPILIPRRLRRTAVSRVGEDPKCAYDALWARRQRHVRREVLPSTRRTPPLLAIIEGSALKTSRVAVVAMR